MNKVILVGRLVANPEYKITEQQKHVCRFRIAINDSKNEAIFLNIVTFDNTAQSCQEWLQKASMVLVDGRLDIHRVEDKDYYSVVAKRVKFLQNTKEKKKKESDNDK